MKAVIFDVEGTLLDVREGLYDQFEALTKELDGASVPREAIRTAAHRTPDQMVRELVSTTVTPLDVIMKRHQELRDEAYRHHVRPYAAADELLPLLKGLGYKVAALAHGDEYTLAALERSGIQQHFDVIVTDQEVDTMQPQEDSVQLALGKLGVLPKEAVLVADTVRDILAAKNAKLYKTIAVTHGLSSPEALRAAGADHIVPDIPAVLDVIG